MFRRDESKWAEIEGTPNASHRHNELTCFKQKCPVPELVSGAKLWFRIRAGKAHGPSARSQMASVRVK